MHNLLFGLVKGKLCRGERSSLDELETEDFLLALRRRHEHCHKFLYLRHNPDEHHRVGEVEYGMEGTYAVEHRCLESRILVNHREVGHGRVGKTEGRDHLSDQPEERVEYDQHPDDSENIEDRVRPGRPLGGVVGHGSGDIGRDGGSDVLTEHHCGSHVKADPAVGHEDHGQCHSGAGGLQDDGEYGSEGKENEHREESVLCQVLHECQCLRMFVKIRYRSLEGRETENQEAETDDALSDAAGTVVLVESEYES